LGLHGVQGPRQPAGTVMSDEYRSDNVPWTDQMVGSSGRRSHSAYTTRGKRGGIGAGPDGPGA
jgi:hypothetical protein